MGAALSIFVLLSVSVFIVRVAAVALRITGLSDSGARFQALSAFTGTGFTTTEAEMVVNYPIRRRIVSLLMIVGNMGLVTVFATVVVSFVRTDGEAGAVASQVAWLLAGLALLWFLILNGTADRIMCSFIGRVLEATTFLGKRRFHRLAQVGDGISICEHRFAENLPGDKVTALTSTLADLNLKLLAVRRSSGGLVVGTDVPGPVGHGDSLIVLGPDAGHEELTSSAM
jgi:uncharacterized membrane protein YuzA (DUF378 family)